jgi:hypothetical protein
MDVQTLLEFQTLMELKSLESGLFWLFVTYIIYSYLRKRPRKRRSKAIVGIVSLAMGFIYTIHFLLAFSTLIVGIIFFNYPLETKASLFAFKFGFFVIGYFLMKMGSNLLRWRMRKIMGVLVVFAGLVNLTPYTSVGGIDKLIDFT